MVHYTYRVYWCKWFLIYARSIHFRWDLLACPWPPGRRATWSQKTCTAPCRRDTWPFAHVCAGVCAFITFVPAQYALWVWSNRWSCRIIFENAPHTHTHSHTHTKFEQEWGVQHGKNSCENCGRARGTAYTHTQSIFKFVPGPAMRCDASRPRPVGLSIIELNLSPARGWIRLCAKYGYSIFASFSHISRSVLCSNRKDAHLTQKRIDKNVQRLQYCMCISEHECVAHSRWVFCCGFGIWALRATERKLKSAYILWAMLGLVVALHPIEASSKTDISIKMLYEIWKIWYKYYFFYCTRSTNQIITTTKTDSSDFWLSVE